MQEHINQAKYSCFSNSRINVNYLQLSELTEDSCRYNRENQRSPA